MFKSVCLIWFIGCQEQLQQDCPETLVVAVEALHSDALLSTYMFHKELDGTVDAQYCTKGNRN